MRVMKKRTLIGLFALSIFGFAQAQEDCKNSLYEANVLYETGKIKDAIDRLVPCLSTKMPSEERFESYRFLAIAYQNLNDIEEAKTYIEKMLREKPDYQKLPNNDPNDFTRLIDQFEISPLLEYSLGAGITFNSPKLNQSYTMFNVPQVYQVSSGFNVALSGNYRFTNSLQLRASLGLNGTTILHEISSEDGWKKIYSENLRMWSLTLSPRYFMPLGKKLKAFGGINAGLGYLTNSRIIVKTDNVKENSTEYNTRDGLADKNRMQPSVGLLGGIYYPLQRGALELEFSYDWYLSSLTNPNQRFADTDFIFLAQYTADDIKLRLFNVHLNYTLPSIYRIKKP